jgi:hypothetical protein
MPCDVIIGKGALNFPCEVPERGHDGPHATPSILASVQARQAWLAQQQAHQAQPAPGLPYQNYEQFQPGVQKPHPRQLTQCFFCPVQVPYEEFYTHTATHAAQGTLQGPPPAQTAAWEPQGPPPGTPTPSPTGVVGAGSADALAQHIAAHPRPQPTVVQFSPVMEQATHMAEVMDYGTHEGQAGYAQQLPSMPYGGDRVMSPNGGAPTLWDEVQAVLNRHSRENMSGTPDFILAQFLASALEAYEQAVNSRDSWYSISQPQEGQPTS